MARLEAWALAVVIAWSSVLAGCGGAEGCPPGCPGPDDGGPPATVNLDRCPILRGCHHVESMELVTSASPWGGPALIGGIVETASGLAVSWIAAPSGLAFPRKVGVSLLETGPGVQLAEFDRSLDEDVPPSLSQRAGELDLVMPPDFKHVVPVHLDTLEPGDAIPLTLGSEGAPAVLGIGQATAAIVGGSPHLLILDATYRAILVDTPVDDQGDPFSLVATCNGVLATWSAPGSPRAAAFTGFGDRVSSNVELRLRNPSPYGFTTVTSTWDGAEVVVSDGSTAVEVDNVGEVQSETPVAARVAVGTDDGLLTVTSDATGVRAVVRERGTGSVLSTIRRESSSFAGIDAGAALVVDHSVYFVDRLGGVSFAWVRVDCGS